MHALKTLIPDALLDALRPAYHRSLALFANILYRNPSRELRVIGITGTKGKSSVAEYMNAILEHAGYRTALVSTIRFKIGDTSEPNMLKMTMPGRFFLPRFLRRARTHGCEWVIIETTTEGAKQHRHRGIAFDALIFTNVAPEHIESHGSFADYVRMKFVIADALVRSPKRPRIMVANADDEYGPEYLALHVDTAVPYARAHAEPMRVSEHGTEITFDGTRIYSPSPGEFSAYNMLAAASCAQAFGIDTATIRAGLESVRLIPGRVERISEGQDFEVVVDYAHTAESLTQLYQAFPERQKICVLGNAGGGRDTWKRPAMAAVAEAHCAHVILTDEDPYDEDPEKIVRDMAAGMHKAPEIIMDRRLAIRRALSLASLGKGDAVLITGKGTDPYIMRAGGAREPWSDAAVAREELQLLLGTTKNPEAV